MAARKVPTVDLVTTVESSIAAMHWLTASDDAMKALALRYAREIEAAVGTEGQRNAVGWLGPHLLGTLKALGGGPAERKALIGVEPVKGRLAALRAAR